MKRNENGTLVPFDFNSIEQEFPAVRHLNVDIGVHTMPPIDSSNVTPEFWVKLAHIIHKVIRIYRLNHIIKFKATKV